MSPIKSLFFEREKVMKKAILMAVALLGIVMLMNGCGGKVAVFPKKNMIN